MVCQVCHLIRRPQQCRWKPEVGTLRTVFSLMSEESVLVGKTHTSNLEVRLLHTYRRWSSNQLPEWMSTDAVFLKSRTEDSKVLLASRQIKIKEWLQLNGEKATRTDQNTKKHCHLWNNFLRPPMPSCSRGTGHSPCPEFPYSALKLRPLGKFDIWLAQVLGHGDSTSTLTTLMAPLEQ